MATMMIEEEDAAEEEKEDKQLEQFVLWMPKVELHAHLNGCIREETLFELAHQKKVVLPYKLFHHQQQPPTTSNSDTLTRNHSLSASLASSCNMYNVKPRSLTDCFEMFHVIPKCVNDRLALERITQEALQDFANHHVVYLELRSTPKCIVGNESVITKKEYIQIILNVMQTFQQQEEHRYQQELLIASKEPASSHSSDSGYPGVRLPMKCRFLVSIDRSLFFQEAEENVDLAIEFFQQQPQQLVVGVDLGGNPTKNDFRDFEASFIKARNAGLKTTIHCGEIPMGESTLDQDPQVVKAYDEVCAILEFGPDRLGHALLLPPSLRDKLVSRATTKQIPVETCPTSNVMTLELAKHQSGNLIHGLQQHPQLQYWLQTNFPISIGTDDPGVFNTNATQELLLLTKAFDLKPEQLQHIVLDSINHGFCRDEIKQKLTTQIREYFSTMVVLSS